MAYMMHTFNRALLQPESTEQAPEPALEPEQVAQQAPAEPEGPSAVALYDYDAGEDNEITFKEGQVIHDIQFVSDDWWSGLAPDGTAVGLFPGKFPTILASGTYMLLIPVCLS